LDKVSFSRIPSIIPLPELLDMQKSSMAEFLQVNVPPEKRKISGLQAAFMDVFPVSNNDESLTIEFVSYDLGETRYTVDEALAKDGVYSAPLKATFRILHREESGKVKQIAEQDVYICDIPLMTENATFVINGAERVVVSQLHRSPGVIFEEDEEKKISSYGKNLYFARMIPYRGAWVEFEYDLNNALFVRLDKHKKLPATVLLRALGLESDEDILRVFYDSEMINVDGADESLVGRVLASDVVLKATGEVLFEANREITREAVAQLRAKKVPEVSVLLLDPAINDVTIRNTLAKDNLKTRKDAINMIYRVLRAQEFIAADQAETYLDNLLFKSIRKYDLTRVGRYKLNKKLAPMAEWIRTRPGFKFEVPNERRRTLTLEDILCTLKYLILLNNDISEIVTSKETFPIEMDDIDHLGNRRVRGIGELLENQIRIGLSQMARIVRERMNIQDKATLAPRAIMNAAPVVAIVRKFFGSSQLSQFMDQTNPLAELTHKRRLSALGPGGLHRKRAGFEVRDVHHTHYGRVCPIETPEGPNIGLISSLACYARVNEYGLIESPYRKVTNGRAGEEVDFLTADVENDLVVAQANAQLDKNGKFVTPRTLCRWRGDFKEFPAEEIDYMDISPLQVVSVSTALIPFLEHDDANRALMGSNMQRQAVPLLVADPPLVGTGIEDRVARDSGAAIVTKRAGQVIGVSGNEIAIYSDDPLPENEPKGDAHIDIYRLKKYLRSNQDTTVNQIPLIRKGMKVKKGEVIADGPSTSGGELALGRNLLVAFMPWEGYNFEDAIILSDRIVKDDLLTSIHIHEFEMEARDTKMGAEEITRDIPNVGADALINLDETGIVRPGAEVVPGDILVGKVAPKGEQQVTPEERLLKVIFGKKAEDTMDASLRVPPGTTGKVIGVRMFVRREKLAAKEENRRGREIEAKYELLIEEVRQDRKDRMAYVDQLKEEKKLTAREADDEKEKIKFYCQRKEQQQRLDMAREKESLKLGDELPVTVNKIVKVYIAAKRKVQVGDKLAGRHGNKGVVSRIVPQEDMPYLPDGRPVDVVLSPLGVPSRMNVGQLLETMLGWAGKQLNVQMNTSVFDGAKEEQVVEQVRRAKDKLRKDGVPEEFLPSDYCKFTLYDGRTGEQFDEKITVGYMYVIKLAHLVEDKIHARSTGPYSLITRQPLGGKAQFGGQRFGEMEVWAVEAYGAAHCLQEFLTVKSDDVSGRAKMYEAIIKGETFSEPGVPESFKVLARELRALGLNIELVRAERGKNGGAPTKVSGKASEEAAAKS
jgi:DNA-directed RNA polymerase subunit beta